MLLNNLTKLAVAVADVDQFYWNLWLVCHLTCSVGVEFR